MVINTTAVAPASVFGGRVAVTARSTVAGPTVSATVTALFDVFDSFPDAFESVVVAVPAVAVSDNELPGVADSINETGSTNSTRPPGIASPDALLHVTFAPLAEHVAGTESPLTKLSPEGNANVTVVGPLDPIDPPLAT